MHLHIVPLYNTLRYYTCTLMAYPENVTTLTSDASYNLWYVDANTAKPQLLCATCCKSQTNDTLMNDTLALS